MWILYRSLSVFATANYELCGSYIEACLCLQLLMVNYVALTEKPVYVCNSYGELCGSYREACQCLQLLLVNYVALIEKPVCVCNC